MKKGCSQLHKQLSIMAKHKADRENSAEYRAVTRADVEIDWQCPLCLKRGSEGFPLRKDFADKVRQEIIIKAGFGEMGDELKTVARKKLLNLTKKLK